MSWAKLIIFRSFQKPSLKVSGPSTCGSKTPYAGFHQICTGSPFLSSLSLSLSDRLCIVSPLTMGTFLQRSQPRKPRFGALDSPLSALFFFTTQHDPPPPNRVDSSLDTGKHGDAPGRCQGYGRLVARQGYRADSLSEREGARSRLVSRASFHYRVG